VAKRDSRRWKSGPVCRISGEIPTTIKSKGTANRHRARQVKAFHNYHQSTCWRIAIRIEGIGFSIRGLVPGSVGPRPEVKQKGRAGMVAWTTAWVA